MTAKQAGLTLVLATALSSGALFAGEPPDIAAEAAVEPESSVDALLDMPIEQLRQTSVSPALEMEVTTASRTPQAVQRTAAAIYVVSNEMIKRSGAKTIPDVLRMVPGVNVGRVNGTTWAISIRGSNSEFSSKLLVQIDGREIYTPTFSGVFWDQEWVLLKDVDRIEVIRGPGATLWGANAVNGIINIVTKSSKDTTGAYAEVGGGTELRDFSRARVGGQIGDDLNYRVYGMHMNSDQGALFRSVRQDEHRHGQAGGRLDWTPTCQDTLTLQGDYFNGVSGPARLSDLSFPVVMEADIRRANALFRWTHEVDDTTDWSVQSYYNHFNRSFGSVVGEDVFDLDCQYHTQLGSRHDVVAGVGYRLNSTNLAFSGPLLTSVPARSTFDTISYFIQDTITLVDDRWFLTFGSKMSHGDFTDFEYQPTAKLAWTPNERTSIWGSISRAVRTPSTTERGIVLTLPSAPQTFWQITGNPLFNSEDVITYELGMRRQSSERLYWDLAVFFSRYDKLVTHDLGDPEPVGAIFIRAGEVQNGGVMDTYGFELAATYEISDAWNLRGSYSFLGEQARVEPPSIFFLTVPGLTPRNTVYFQSSMDLTHTVDLDLMFRYVDELSGLIGAPSYLVMDARVAWEPRKGLEFAVVGRNLCGERIHRETVGTTLTQVEQEVYGYVSWEY